MQVLIDGVYVDALTISGIDGYTTVLGDTAYITAPLPDGYMLVGDAGNVATGVPVTGDISITNTGVVTVENVLASKVTLGGNLTETISGVLTITGGTAALLHNVTIKVQKASATTDGYLSAEDFVNFSSGASTAGTYSRVFIGSGA